MDRSFEGIRMNLREGQKVLVKVKTFNELGRNPVMVTHWWMKKFDKYVGKKIEAEVVTSPTSQTYLCWPGLGASGFDLTWVDIIKEDI